MEHAEQVPGGCESHVVAEVLHLTPIKHAPRSFRSVRLRANVSVMLAVRAEDGGRHLVTPGFRPARGRTFLWPRRPYIQYSRPQVKAEFLMAFQH
jgi:hypothetical protein